MNNNDLIDTSYYLFFFFNHIYNIFIEPRNLPSHNLNMTIYYTQWNFQNM